MIKAVAGGGGKAMRKAGNLQELDEGMEISAREAENYFGNPEICLEKYYEKARHIEVQILADGFGNVVVPGERECSVQRRYQKVIEESPSVMLSRSTRERMRDIARAITRDIGYVGAGTVEFLVDARQNIYFLEMNTRIQVEHPVTEMVTGLDLIEQQVRIAEGHPLPFSGGEISQRGHAVEARIYAEDPAAGFLPSPGIIHTYHEPVMPGVRIDSGTDGPTAVHPGYDPLIAKVIAHGNNRDEAIQRLSAALEDFTIAGVRTNITFLLALLRDGAFTINRISTQWLEQAAPRIIGRMKEQAAAVPQSQVYALWLAWQLFHKQPARAKGTWQRIGYWRQVIKKSVVTDQGQTDLYANLTGKRHFTFRFGDRDWQAELKEMDEDGRITLILDGRWITGTVSSGFDAEDVVFTGAAEFRLKPLDFLPPEPFTQKMNTKGSLGKRVITSPLHGRIIKINAGIGKKVARGELLFILDAMKIENKIISPFDGLIREVRVNAGDQVAINQPVLVIE